MAAVTYVVKPYVVPHDLGCDGRVQVSSGVEG
jgi:hypothetical protein